MQNYIIFIINTYLKNFSTYFLFFFITTILLFLIIKTASFTGLIDVPNIRSSHKKPTPCGGGLALVLIILCANYKILYICPEFFLGALLTSIIGLWDDLKPLPVLPRLLTQILVVFFVIFLLPVNNPIHGIPIIFVKIILFFAGVWFINVYNFMDGIDGLAGGYANAASLGFLYCINNLLIVEGWNINIYTQIIYITLPFIIFNWSPAKIFLGDIGSTFFGFTFFSLGVRSLMYSNQLIYSFIIIMSFFWIDATLTLVFRFFRGQKIFKAHKEHAFQKAALIFGHWKVSCFIIVTTIFWLNPMAKLTIQNIDNAFIYSVISILPILGFILIFKPGAPVENESSFLRFFNSHIKNSSK
jgi:Fuc2NAc and GlcNAc transferase